MIDPEIVELAKQVDEIAEDVNTHRPLAGSRDGPGANSVGRDLAVARTHLQTAALWLRKAADTL